MMEKYKIGRRFQTKQCFDKIFLRVSYLVQTYLEPPSDCPKGLKTSPYKGCRRRQIPIGCDDLI